MREHWSMSVRMFYSLSLSISVFFPLYVSLSILFLPFLFTFTLPLSAISPTFFLCTSFSLPLLTLSPSHSPSSPPLSFYLSPFSVSFILLYLSPSLSTNLFIINGVTVTGVPISNRSILLISWGSILAERASRLSGFRFPSLFHGESQGKGFIGKDFNLNSLHIDKRRKIWKSVLEHYQHIKHHRKSRKLPIILRYHPILQRFECRILTLGMSKSLIHPFKMCS